MFLLNHIILDANYQFYNDSFLNQTTDIVRYVWKKNGFPFNEAQFVCVSQVLTVQSSTAVISCIVVNKGKCGWVKNQDAAEIIIGPVSSYM